MRDLKREIDEPARHPFMFAKVYYPVDETGQKEIRCKRSILKRVQVILDSMRIGHFKIRRNPFPFDGVCPVLARRNGSGLKLAICL